MAKELTTEEIYEELGGYKITVTQVNKDAVGSRDFEPWHLLDACARGILVAHRAIAEAQKTAMDGPTSGAIN